MGVANAVAADVLSYSALILAGGRGLRMGGQDKGWVRWQGKPLIEHALSRVKRQTLPPAEILISANRHLNEYALTGARVVSDLHQGFEGPLAGLEAGLLHARCDWVMVVPCDMPILPLNLVQRLFEGIGSQLAAVAATGADLHPLCLLVHRSLAKSVSARLEARHASVKPWVSEIGAAMVKFDDEVCAFENVNAWKEHHGNSTEKHL